MTEEFPNNSSRASQGASSDADHQIEKIISGDAIVRKQSGFRRFRRSFIAGDASSVSEHILWNLVIPSAKDAMSDMLTTFVDMMIYGEKRNRFSGPNSAPKSGLGSTSTMNYGAISSGGRVVFSPSGQGPIVEQPTRVDPSEIILRTRPEAEAVIGKMFETLERYRMVSLGDLYGMINHSTSPMDYKYGWKDLSNSDVQRVKLGYRLVLPNLEDIS